MKRLLIVLLVLVVWSALRAGATSTAFRREIIVNAPPKVAWDYFNRPMEWTSWLGGGSPSYVGPTEVIGPDTIARFGGAFEFRVTEFQPYTRWTWSAPMGSTTIDYAHIFEPINDSQTRMVFHQTIRGFGNDVLATLLAVVTGLGGHQAALDRLAVEINNLPTASK